MKSIIFIAMIAIIGCFACTKSSTSPNSPDPPSSSPYYVKATINGTNVDYSNYTGALKPNPASLYVFGYNSNAANADGISISFSLIGVGAPGNQPTLGLGV